MFCLSTYTTYTYTKSCPHCQNPYQTSLNKYNYTAGSPIQECRKCGKSFIDADYKEPVLYPGLFTKPRRVAGIGFFIIAVAFLLIGIRPMPLFALLLSLFGPEMLKFYMIFVVFSYVLSGINCVFGIRSLMRRIKNYDELFSRWEQTMAESKQRMSDPEYSKLVHDIYNKNK